MSSRHCSFFAAIVLCAPLLGAQTKLTTFSGTASGDLLGQHVAGAGDVDGDGTPELLISGWNDGGTPGSALVSGATLLPLAVFPGRNSVAGVGDVDGDGVNDIAVGGGPANIVVYSGQSLLPLWSDNAPVSYFGFACAGAGDVDGDGLPDVIVGSGTDDFFDAGGDTFRVSRGLDGSTWHEVNWFNPFDFPAGMGWAVAAYRDVDSDRFDEYLVGVPFASAVTGPAGTDHLTHTGHVRVYDGATGNVIQTWAGDHSGDALGWSVSSGGDLDGDGLHDVVAGTGGNAFSNPMYVRAWSAADATELWTFSGVGTGPMVVDTLEDLDGDDCADVLVGSSRDASVWVLSGRTGAILFTLVGDDQFGDAVAAVGDVDGDGREDFLVGNWLAGPPATGKAHLYSGRPEPFTDLHGGLGGSLGVEPKLRGIGTLEPGSSGELRLRDALPNQTGLLFFDVVIADLPFLGGVLVPGVGFPPLPLVTDSSGKAVLPWASWPAAVPSYSKIFAQAWIADSGAPYGAAASPALQFWTP